jgi:hypothetical protein
VHGERFARIRPANTLVQAQLVGDDLLVEIRVRGGDRRRRCRDGVMRCSLRLNNDLPIADHVALARAAERAGIDQFWISNDLFLRSAPVLLAAVAHATERIEIGSCILNPHTIHRRSSPCSPRPWTSFRRPLQSRPRRGAA